MKKKKTKAINTNGGPADNSNYEAPDNSVKIQDGDKGFALVKKNYNRFIWTWNQYGKSQMKK